MLLYESACLLDAIVHKCAQRHLGCCDVLKVFLSVFLMMRLMGIFMALKREANTVLGTYLLYCFHELDFISKMLE